MTLVVYIVAGIIIGSVIYCSAYYEGYKTGRRLSEES